MELKYTTHIITKQLLELEAVIALFDEDGINREGKIKFLKIQMYGRSYSK